MRSLWIVGIVALGLLGAGCSTGNSASTTTTKAKSTTSTTLGTGPVTPTAKDKRACTDFNTFKTESASSPATVAELKAALKEVRKAKNRELHAEGKAWALAVLHGHKSASTKAEANIASICNRMGLG